MRIAGGTAAAVLLLAAPAFPVPFEVTRLETGAATQPLGIDEPRPRLSWALASEHRGVAQAAFQVLVASSPQGAREARADLWDSGRVASPAPFVRYAGRPLASRTRYHWAVRVWLADGSASEWTAPTWFETAFLTSGEWRARWIAGPERPRVLSAADGERDDAAIRAAGELCRPVAWIDSFASRRFKNDQGECRELR